MANVTEVVIELDNTEEIRNALFARRETILKACGAAAQGYADANITRLHAIKTSNLKNSITFEVEGNTMTVGTNVEYAPYVEFGTGIYAEHSGAKKIPWVYRDDEGKFHTTSGRKKKPFLKPAMEDHKQDYINYIKNGLMGK